MKLVDDIKLPQRTGRYKVAELLSHTHRLIADYKVNHHLQQLIVPIINCSSIPAILSKLSNKYLEL